MGMRKWLIVGQVETILTGTDSCDPVRRTAWGTIVVGEEVDTGWLLEIINPLGTTNVVFDRSSGTFAGGTVPAILRCVLRSDGWRSRGSRCTRTASCTTATRTGPRAASRAVRTSNSSPPRPGTGGAIADLNQSPLASGKVYGLRLGKRSEQHRLRSGLQYRPRHLGARLPRRSTPTSEPRGDAQADGVLPARGCRDRSLSALRRIGPLLREQHRQRG